jgi:hypothetical protein
MNDEHRGTQADRNRPPDDDPDAELHVCSWCGRLLEGDPEDELEGDGSGHDICGDCNRTKNFDACELGL